MQRNIPLTETGRWFVGGQPVPMDEQDPWSPVSRETQAALRGGVSAPQVSIPRSAPAPAPSTAEDTSRLPPAAFAELCIGLAGEDFAALALAYRAVRGQPGFFADYARQVARPLGRPTRLQHAAMLGAAFSQSARIFLKREDLRSVAVEIEHATAQAYVASKLGARTLVTAADSEPHALAVAAAAPQFGLSCVVLMRTLEIETRGLLAARLHGLNARVQDASDLDGATADPREPAIRYWKAAAAERYLALPVGTGPAPYPAISADWMALVGHETELQLRARAEAGRARTFVAAVHSEADSIGFMLPQLARGDVELVYAEPDDTRARSSERLAACGGLAREHAELRATGRLTYLPIPDLEAAEAGRLALEKEGVVLSPEDARAVAAARRLAQRDGARDIVVLAA